MVGRLQPSCIQSLAFMSAGVRPGVLTSAKSGELLVPSKLVFSRLSHEVFAMLGDICAGFLGGSIVLLDALVAE